MIQKAQNKPLTPNDKILDCSKLKAVADDNINVTKKLKVVSERVEIIVGKGENAVNHHFLLFLQCFQKPAGLGSLKLELNCHGGLVVRASTSGGRGFDPWPRQSKVFKTNST